MNLERKDNKPTKIYISLGQRDGRLFTGEVYPFARVSNYMLICIFALEKNEEELE